MEPAAAVMTERALGVPLSYHRISDIRRRPAVNHRKKEQPTDADCSLQLITF